MDLSGLSEEEILRKIEKTLPRDAAKGATGPWESSSEATVNSERSIYATLDTERSTLNIELNADRCASNHESAGIKPK